MNEYLTEQEQIELFKKWLKQYSGVILGGLALAIICIMGYRFWNDREIAKATQASVIYDEMLTSRAQNNNETTGLQAKNLLSKAADSAYANMASLMMARLAIVNKDYSLAEKNLQTVMNDSSDESIRQIARIRLARLKLANNEAQGALTLLDTVDDPNFKSLIDEIKGDAYVWLKKPDLARNAYQSALNSLPNAEVMRPLLQMKFDNLST